MPYRDPEQRRAAKARWIKNNPALHLLRSRLYARRYRNRQKRTRDS